MSEPSVCGGNAAFDHLLVERQEEHLACKEVRGAGVVICLERGADDLHYVPADVTATSLSLPSLKTRVV